MQNDNYENPKVPQRNQGNNLTGGYNNAPNNNFNYDMKMNCIGSAPRDLYYLSLID